MGERRLQGVLQRIRSLARAGEAGGTDAELLRRFIHEWDEAAFEALMRRYGPMVWGVCKRVLREAHDAEDAFQATFLVLVRKAASIARRELLGNWLYGVAYRTAQAARVAAARRRAKEREAGAMPRDGASQAEGWRDALPLLDQELNGLPDRLRTPILLCDLQGKSRREAAQQLRLPEGTLSSRLARGRVLLAHRLARHGLTVAGGALAAALTADAASAAMPPILAASTIRAAAAFAAGHATLVSAQVAALTEGVMKTMLWTKIKMTAALLLATGLLAVGTAAAVLTPEKPRLDDASAAAVAGAAPVDDKPRPSDSDKKERIPIAADHDDYEAAVARGLKWLALHQAADGHWSLDEFQKFAHKEPRPDSPTFGDECDGQATTKNDVAATAFGLLPFLGAGYTSKAVADKAFPDYSKTVQAGLDWLLQQQDKDGAFDAKSMYANALAARVVCEAYGLGADPALKGPAQKAVQFVESAQDADGGGWRYAPKMVGDLSVTGWQLGALRSGQIAGLDVDKKTLQRAEKFLDSCETPAHGYTYLPASPQTLSMTAVGMVCRQRLGAGPRNPALWAGVDLVKAGLPGKGDKTSTENDVYYLYYATQAMFDMGGDARDFWTKGPEGKGGVREFLLGRQQKPGDADGKKACQDGSWPADGRWKQAGGRIMETSLSLLILEVYFKK